MSLTFVLGSAGSGKSTWLFDHMIREAGEHPDQNYLILVPEQFTMSTQMELVSRSPHHAIMNIDVLSFKRLAYRVFDELGTTLLDVLEDTGKNLLLRRVAQEREGDLTVLRGNMKRSGYIDEMKSLLTELTQYNIDPEELREMIDAPGMSSAFRRKAKDVLVMYEGFCDAIADRYITAEEILGRLLDVIEDSKMVRGAVIGFDGFTGFTPIQNDLMRRMLSLSGEMYVTVSIDPRERIFGAYQDHELFAMSKKMINSLAGMAREGHIPVLEPVVLSGPKRFAEGGMLSHLEQNLFRPAHTAWELPAEGTKVCDRIRIGRCATPRDELLYAAAQIREIVRTRGLRYRDCAIMCANMEDYREYVPGVFRACGVPYYIDADTDILFHPLTEFISSALDMVTEHFSEESVLHHLRSGLYELPAVDCDLFANYIHAKGIRGFSRYQRRFAAKPKNYTQEMVVRCDDLRQQLMHVIGPFVETVSGGEHPVLSYATAIWNLLEAVRAQDQLEEMAKACEAEGDDITASVNRRIFPLVMDLLDKMTHLLADEQMDIEEFTELLSAGLAAVKISTIPPSSDSVVVGDMERSRLEHIRVLFIAGASDASIPKALGSGGIFSQIEREQLKEDDFELAPTDRERSFMQRFYIYLAVTKPSDELVITYARLGNDGKALRKSYLIGMIEDLFPQIEVGNLEEASPLSHVVTGASARPYLVQLLREYAAGELWSDESVQEVFAALLAELNSSDAGSGELADLLNTAFYHHVPERLSEELMHRAAGDTVQGSVSRLEKYAACAYAYFLTYGLRLTEREEPDLASPDLGTIYHDTLEAYSEELMHEGLTWQDVSREDSDRILDESLDKAIASFDRAELLEDPKAAYVMKRVHHTMQRTIETLTKQVRSGTFVPTAFEADFCRSDDLKSMQFQLSDGDTMRLGGRIDRVDLYRRDGRIYVKIIDYKSGDKDIDLTQMYYGLQIQLVLYMSAALEKLKKEHAGEEVHPGGMFYYHIDDPWVEGESQDDAASIDQKMMKELMMKGLFNGDDEVVAALDRALDPAQGMSARSLVVKASRKKDGELAATSNDISEEEFTLFGDYIHQHVKKSGEDIHAGRMAVNPYRLKKSTACDYCPYHAVCGFDPGLAGYGYRRFRSLDKDDAIALMREALESGEEV